MSDLREVVARALDELRRNAAEQGWTPDEKDDADAVLAAIREEHVIVGRPGEDVLERAIHEATIATFGLKHGVAVVDRAVETAAPWIRAAALEEALAAVREEHLENRFTDDDAAYDRAITDAENAIRALIGGGSNAG